MAARTGVGVRRLWRAAACAAALAGAGARADVVPSSSLRLSLEERYDNGVLLSEEAGGSQLMTRISPELTLGLRGRTFGVTGSYAPNVLWRHGSGEASLDHQLGLGLSKRWSRTFQVGLEVDAWRVSDPTSLPRLNLARAGEPVTYGRGDAWAQVALTRRWLLRGSYRLEGARIELPERSREPSLMHQPGAELSYRLTPRSTLGAEYRFQSFELGAEGAGAHHVGLALSHRLSRQARLDVRGGPVWYRGNDGQEGLLPRAILGLASEGRYFDWGVALGHDLVGASGFRAALWADFASVTAGWRFSRTVHGYALANYFRNGVAPNVGLLPGDGGERPTQGYGLGAALEWQLHPSLALRGTVNRIQQVGDVLAGRDMTHNIVSVRAVLTAWE